MARTLATSLGALAGIGAAPQPATPAPPVDAAVAAEAFVAACWQGLRRPAAFRRAIARSPLHFRRIEGASGEARYRRANAGIDYRANQRCTILLTLNTRAEADRVVERVSQLIGLPLPAGLTNNPGTAAAYRWPGQPVEGGSLGISGNLELPWPGRIRMEGARVRLTVSVYFSPAP